MLISSRVLSVSSEISGCLFLFARSEVAVLVHFFPLKFYFGRKNKSRENILHLAYYI